MRNATTHLLDLSNPVHAYLYGFIQTDGHLSQSTRNKGRLQIEISIRDAAILEQLSAAIPCYSRVSFRTRTTNFADEKQFASLTVCGKEFRDELIELGMMYGKKSEKIDIPHCSFSEADYFRGIIDGDGSLGYTANKFPFLSLCIASEKMAVAYEAFTRKITGKEKRLNRNSRDGIYNISLFKEDAQSVAATLYYKGCVAIPRKKQLALDIQLWKRPSTMKRIPNKKFWTDEQDSFILSHSIEESAFELRRTPQSIKMRL
jgi:hypothetical protein